MHRFRCTPALALTLLLACSSPGANRPSDAARDSTAPSRDAAATITASEMREHIAFLASDALRGRDTPSPGLDSAAMYLSRGFAALGLEPAGDDGTFVQRYALPRIALDTGRTRLRLRTPAGDVTLTYARDYFALAGEPGTVEAPVVHVRAGEAGGAASRGRIPVVALDGSVARAWGTTIAGARRAAGAAGAAAIVFVLEPSTTRGTVAALARLGSRPRRLVGRVESIPAFFVRREAVRDAFLAAGLDVDSPPDGRGGGAIGPGLSGSAPVRVLDSPGAPNVVALLPGRDPVLRDSYVIFSAHMDHVGVGGTDASGDSIYNGADDNASGTAALLEVAEAFASLPRPPARSLVFLAVSGEEKGLLGSRWFTEHPTIPLERAVADINVDMIARNSPDSVVVIGQEYSSLGPLVREVARRHPEVGLTVAEDIWPEQRFFFRSDHYSFARKEIPALFFFAGTHADYHQPSDEPALTDPDKAARVARLIFLTGHAVAMAPEPPRWTDDGLAEVRASPR